MIIQLVHELLAQNQSTSSSLSKAYIVARIQIVPNDNNFSCPIIQLVDPTTHQNVKCQVDQINPYSNNQIVCLRQWTWTILTDGSVFVGFIWDPSCLDGLDVIMQKHTARCQKLLNDSIIYRPLQLRKSNQLAVLNISGKVSAISGVYQRKAGSIPCYFVELEDEDYTLCVWFLGKEFIKYYWDFRIGNYYVFSDVQVATLALNQTKRGILRYIPIQSKYFCITQYQGQILENAAARIPSLTEHTSVFPPAVWLKSDADDSHTYEGVITRAIDSVLGIYEIDHQYTLCLFHSARLSLPCHPKTRIRLHHIHSVQIQADNSLLLNNHWKSSFSSDAPKTYSFLIACPRSRIEILSIPIYTTASEIPLDMKACSMNSLDQSSFDENMNFMQLLQTLEFKWTLYYYQLFMSISMSPNALLQATQNYASTLLSQDHNEAADQKLSRFTSFLEFNQFCNAVPSSRNAKFSLQTYPSIEKLKKLGSQKSQSKYSPPLSDLNIQHASFEDCPIIGVVDAFSDGQLCLKDGTGYIPLLVVYPKDHSRDIILIETLCIIRRFDYINEETSFKNSSGNACKTENIYLTCYIEDVDILFTGQSHLLTNLPDASVINSFLDHFKAEEKDDVLTILHIRNIQPTRAVFSSKNTVVLESHIIAICYDVIHPDSTCQTVSPHFVTLVLSSERDSLYQLAQFHIGRWMASSYKNPRQSLWRVGSKMKIVPIATNTSKIHIVPVLNPVLHFKVPKIYDVKGIQKISAQYNSEYSGKHIQKTINLIGLVVYKEYVSSRDSLMPENRQRIWELYKTHRVGCPQMTSHSILVRLRSGLSTFDIYINLGLQIMPLGVIPGSVVLFTNLGLKPKRQGSVIYGFGTTCTYFTLLETSQDLNISVDQDIPTYMLGESVPEQRRLFKAVCHIKLLKLHMQWICKTCGLCAMADKCGGLCDDARAVFKVKMTLEVRDGTAACLSYTEDESLLFLLWGCSQSQRNNIKQQVFSSGEPFSYNSLDKYQEQSQLEKLCLKNNTPGRYWVYGYFLTNGDMEGLPGFYFSRMIKTVHLEPITNLSDSKVKAPFEYPTFVSSSLCDQYKVFRLIPYAVQNNIKEIYQLTERINKHYIKGGQ
ncbi:CST, telomere maintenance, complex subunit CTC1-domain-containing protein [Phycomyces blakesleeanus]